MRSFILHFKNTAKWLYLCMMRCAFKQVNTVLLLAVYLFVVLTHIFFIQNHSSGSSKPQYHYNSIFKRKIDGVGAQKIAFLHRTDKSILNDKQDTNSLILKYADTFLLLFLIRWGFISKSTFNQFKLGYFPFPVRLQHCLRI